MGSPPFQSLIYNGSPPFQTYSSSNLQNAVPLQSFNYMGRSVPLQSLSLSNQQSMQKKLSPPKPIQLVIRSGNNGSPIAISPEKASFNMKKPQNLAGETSKPPAAPRKRRPKKGKGLWAGGRPCPEPMIAPPGLPEWPQIADVRSKLQKLPEGKKDLDCREYGSKRPNYDNED